MDGKLIINGKTAFYLFMMVIGIVILTVWITGLDLKRTVYHNAVYSLSIINLLFLVFVTYGLYRGTKIKDDYKGLKSEPELSKGGVDVPVEIIAEFASDGIEGLVIGILLWIGVTILSIILLFFFETVVLAVLGILMGILYWIFYRASRLILRYSKFTKNNLKMSFGIGLRYSLLYSGWIYGILWIIEFLKE